MDKIDNSSTVVIDFREYERAHKRYESSDEKEIEINGLILHKVIYKFINPVNSSIVIVVGTVGVPKWNDFFDEKGMHHQLREVAIRFINAHYDQDDLIHLIVRSAFIVEGISQIDEIGEYLGFTTKKEYWLPEKDVHDLLGVRNDPDARNSFVYRKYAIAKTKKKMKNLLFYEKPQDEKEIKKEFIQNHAYEIYQMSGSMNYNESDLRCPLCGSRYIAYNSNDYYYPFVSKNDIVDKTFPLTRDKYMCHKYRCLVCYTYFGLMKECEMVFEFERGAFFDGTLDYKMFEHNDHMRFRGFCANEFCHMPSYEFCFPKYEMDVFCQIVKPLKRWKRKCECMFEVYDGYGWTVYYNYDGVKIHSNGYESYPIGYRKAVESLQRAVESLCEKYASKYTREGIEERIRL